MNRLAKEHSIYLQQHSKNQVQWRPWGSDAIGAARKNDKPLFISIGYSACHWCHVMADESFEDVETADIINEYFIPVKVDREEYPDLDKKYQFYMQTIRQQGGWPLSIFATSEGFPFYGGTYLPKEAKYGLPSLKQLASSLSDTYTHESKKIDNICINYKSFVSNFEFAKYTNKDFRALPYGNFIESYKEKRIINRNGLKSDTKFPNIPFLLCLVDNFYNYDGISHFLEVTAKSLCLSGIYDHIDHGFYRYTVDEDWDIPHFEKMLYDNALNAIFLIKMYKITGNKLYSHISRKTLDFIINNLNSNFGYIASFDADSMNDISQREEGFYYKIKKSDLTLFSASDLDILNRYLILNEGVVRFKKIVDVDEYLLCEPIFDRLKSVVRRFRKPPLNDNKVIVRSWRGLARYQFVYAEVTNDDYYFKKGVNLFNNIEEHLIQGDEVYRINYDGYIFKHKCLEDYAYCINCANYIFKLTDDNHYKDTAKKLMNYVINNFYSGGKIYLDLDKEISDTFDEAMPSPFGIMVENMINLRNITGTADNLTSVIDYASDRAKRFPSGHPTVLSSLLKFLAIHDDTEKNGNI